MPTASNKDSHISCAGELTNDWPYADFVRCTEETQQGERWAQQPRQDVNVGDRGDIQHKSTKVLPVSTSQRS